MAIICVSEIRKTIIDETFRQQIEDTIIALPEPEQQQALKKWIFDKANSFLERCEIVEEDEEMPTLLMWYYVQLKSEWSQLNTEVQYQPLRSEEPDMMLIFKASTLSLLLAQIEQILSYVDVERATDYLSDPIWKEDDLSSFKVSNEQQSDLVVRSEDLQSSQIRVFDEIREAVELLETEKAQLNGSYGKLKSKLDQIQSRFHQLTQNSNQLRLGIIELRQTQAQDLFERLDRFFQDAQHTFGVWGDFSVGGSSIMIERQTVDIMVEPFSRLMRMMLRIAAPFNESIQIRLRVRFAGRKLKIGLRVRSENMEFLHEIINMENSCKTGMFESVKELLASVGGTLEVVQKKATDVEIMSVLPNNTNVMEESVIFEAGSVIAGIPRGFVSQMVSVNEEKLQSVNTHPTLVERGEVYPYLNLNTLLNEHSDDKDYVAVLINQSGKRLALGVSKVIGIETVSLQPLGAYESESPLVQSIGMTGSGLILNFLDMGMLFDMDIVQPHQMPSLQAQN